MQETDEEQYWMKGLHERFAWEGGWRLSDVSQRVTRLEGTVEIGKNVFTIEL